MKKVDFNYVDFDSYRILQGQIRQLEFLQSDEDTFEFEVEAKLDALKAEFQLHDANISLFFELMSRKNGIYFAKKAQWELKNKVKVEETLVLEEYDFSEVQGITWRYDLGKTVTMKRGTLSDKHPFREGDLVEIIAYAGKGVLDQKWQYIVKHESSNDDTTFIVNDFEVV